jgi:hypothetical protein
MRFGFQLGCAFLGARVGSPYPSLAAVFLADAGHDESGLLSDVVGSLQEHTIVRLIEGTQRAVDRIRPGWFGLYRRSRGPALVQPPVWLIDPRRPARPCHARRQERMS